MKLEIAPYVGIGPMHFGMDPDHLEAVAGSPCRSKRTAAGIRYGYDFGGTLLFEQSAMGLRLVEMGFHRHCLDLIYRDMNIFRSKREAVLQRFLDEDKGVVEIVGFLIFPTIGMTLTGFHSGPEEDLALTVFARGRWDRRIASARPV